MHIIAIASVFPILYFLTGGWAVSIKKCVVYPVLVLKIAGTQIVGANPKTIGISNSVFCKFIMSRTHALNCNINKTSECTFIKYILFHITNHQHVSDVHMTVIRVS